MPKQKLGYKHLSARLSVITLGCDFPLLLISGAARRAWGVQVVSALKRVKQTSTSVRCQGFQE